MADAGANAPQSTLFKPVSAPWPYGKPEKEPAQPKAQAPAPMEFKPENPTDPESVRSALFNQRKYEATARMAGKPATAGAAGPGPGPQPAGVVPAMAMEPAAPAPSPSPALAPSPTGPGQYSGPGFFQTLGRAWKSIPAVIADTIGNIAGASITASPSEFAGMASDLVADPTGGRMIVRSSWNRIADMTGMKKWESPGQKILRATLKDEDFQKAGDLAKDLDIGYATAMRDIRKGIVGPEWSEKEYKKLNEQPMPDYDTNPVQAAMQTVARFPTLLPDLMFIGSFATKVNPALGFTLTANQMSSSMVDQLADMGMDMETATKYGRAFGISAGPVGYAKMVAYSRAIQNKPFLSMLSENPKLKLALGAAGLLAEGGEQGIQDFLRFYWAKKAVDEFNTKYHPDPKDPKRIPSDPDDTFDWKDWRNSALYGLIMGGASRGIGKAIDAMSKGPSAATQEQYFLARQNEDLEFARTVDGIITGQKDAAEGATYQTHANTLLRQAFRKSGLTMAQISETAKYPQGGLVLKQIIEGYLNDTYGPQHTQKILLSMGIDERSAKEAASNVVRSIKVEDNVQTLIDALTNNDPDAPNARAIKAIMQTGEIRESDIRTLTGLDGPEAKEVFRTMAGTEVGDIGPGTPRTAAGARSTKTPRDVIKVSPDVLRQMVAMNAENASYNRLGVVSELAQKAVDLLRSEPDMSANAMRRALDVDRQTFKEITQRLVDAGVEDAAELNRVAEVHNRIMDVTEAAERMLRLRNIELAKATNSDIMDLTGLPKQDADAVLAMIQRRAAGETEPGESVRTRMTPSRTGAELVVEEPPPYGARPSRFQRNPALSDGENDAIIAQGKNPMRSRPDQEPPKGDELTALKQDPVVRFLQKADHDMYVRAIEGDLSEAEYGWAVKRMAYEATNGPWKPSDDSQPDPETSPNRTIYVTRMNQDGTTTGDDGKEVREFRKVSARPSTRKGYWIVTPAKGEGDIKWPERGITLKAGGELEVPASLLHPEGGDDGAPDVSVSRLTPFPRTGFYKIVVRLKDGTIRSEWANRKADGTLQILEADGGTVKRAPEVLDALKKNRLVSVREAEEVVRQAEESRTGTKAAPSEEDQAEPYQPRLRLKPRPAIPEGESVDEATFGVRPSKTTIKPTPADQPADPEGGDALSRRGRVELPDIDQPAPAQPKRILNFANAQQTSAAANPPGAPSAPPRPWLVAKDWDGQTIQTKRRALYSRGFTPEMVQRLYKDYSTQQIRSLLVDKQMTAESIAALYRFREGIGQSVKARPNTIYETALGWLGRRLMANHVASATGLPTLHRWMVGKMHDAEKKSAEMTCRFADEILTVNDQNSIAASAVRNHIAERIAVQGLRGRNKTSEIEFKNLTGDELLFLHMQRARWMAENRDDVEMKTLSRRGIIDQKNNHIFEGMTKVEIEEFFRKYVDTPENKIIADRIKEAWARHITPEVVRVANELGIDIEVVQEYIARRRMGDKTFGNADVIAGIKKYAREYSGAKDAPGSEKPMYLEGAFASYLKSSSEAAEFVGKSRISEEIRGTLEGLANSPEARAKLGDPNTNIWKIFNQAVDQFENANSIKQMAKYDWYAKKLAQIISQRSPGIFGFNMGTMLNQYAAVEPLYGFFQNRAAVTDNIGLMLGERLYKRTNPLMYELVKRVAAEEPRLHLRTETAKVAALIDEPSIDAMLRNRQKLSMKGTTAIDRNSVLLTIAAAIHDQILRTVPTEPNVTKAWIYMRPEARARVLSMAGDRAAEIVASSQPSGSATFKTLGSESGIVGRTVNLYQNAPNALRSSVLSDVLLAANTTDPVTRAYHLGQARRGAFYSILLPSIHVAAVRAFMYRQGGEAFLVGTLKLLSHMTGKKLWEKEDTEEAKYRNNARKQSLMNYFITTLAESAFGGFSGKGAAQILQLPMILNAGSSGQALDQTAEQFSSASDEIMRMSTLPGLSEMSGFAQGFADLGMAIGHWNDLSRGSEVEVLPDGRKRNRTFNRKKKELMFRRSLSRAVNGIGRGAQLWGHWQLSRASQYGLPQYLSKYFIPGRRHSTAFTQEDATEPQVGPLEQAADAEEQEDVEQDAQER